MKTFNHATVDELDASRCLLVGIAVQTVPEVYTDQHQTMLANKTGIWAFELLQPAHGIE